MRKADLKCSKTIAGCDFIADSVRKCFVFGKYAEQFIEASNYKSSVLGVRPNQMPNPGMEPVKVIFDRDLILSHIGKMDLSWAEVSRVDSCVYYTAIALFGDKYWVTRDRSGLFCLRVFNRGF